MITGIEENPQSKAEVVLRSRKANRRTLKGCITQAERIQQQLRNVGMQYVDVKPIVFKALHAVHELIDQCKVTIKQTGEAL